ncbi:MAG: non-homologous end-joining DNA ligase [Gemmatimonadota bacterium]
MTPPPEDRLERYRAKRQASRTPEPFGAREGQGPGVAAGGHLFVFHKHHARNLHWDLRLELDGALESWAVPKGPSPDPADKRLAMHVEPHPLDYAEFEGVIPEGEYGAGPSIVWDKGVWVPLKDPHEGLRDGKLLFELRGFKVRGVWTLVHTPKAGENHWLLIKETGDAYVDERGTGLYPDDSIYSGLEVDELPEAGEHRRAVAERAKDVGGVRRALGAADVEVMKATRRDDVFDDPDWVYEIKYDGYRLVVGRDPEGRVSLVSRNGNDLTATFPDVARAVSGLPYGGLVLDGEVVVHDQAGLPAFGRLQRRGRLQNRRDIQRAALELPATYYAFDLLAVEGFDLRDLPLVERKAMLRGLLPTVGPVRFSDHVREHGTAVYRQMESMGLEGVVAKRADSRYRGGRSESWYKIRVDRTDDFVVVGWTDPKGSRAGFGALHLARWVSPDAAAVPGTGSDDSAQDAGADGRAGAASRPGREPVLVWRGSVGTGFGEADIASLSEELEELGEGMDGPAAVAPGAVDPEGAELPGGEAHHWVRPELVVEVRFREITEAGVLRHASFLRVRDDKAADECLEGAREADVDPLPPEPPPEAAAPEKVVPFTNLEKVFWPAEGDGKAHTKGDLVRYYEAISGWLLPYLEDRPLVLTRYPDGIHGKSFYQKDAPAWAPDWIRTVTVWSESGEKELDYFVAEDVETLLYLANLGTIPLHVWHSRASTLARPDWCLLDLDPKDAPFEHVVEIALFLHDLCEGIGLPHHVKTSGSTGLHVLIPLGRQVTYDQSRALGELLANVTVRALPGIATVERVVRKRAGKVYVDYLQNRHGQLVAAPFCVRAKPGATVSAPLRWDEVGPGLDLRDHTIDTVPARMAALEDGDPLRPVLTGKPDLLAALRALHERTE